MNRPTTWVLLRGLTRERRHWGDFVDHLHQAFPAARICAPDLPGSGGRHREPSPTDISAMTESIRAALLASGAAPPYRLLALSLGGMVAIDWATRHAGEIQAAVLINTSLARFNPFHHRLRPANYPALCRLLWGGGGVEAREATVLRLTSARPDEQPNAVHNWSAIRRDAPVTSANALRQLLAAIRFHAPLAPPPVPLLLLAGAGDRLVNPECSRAVARAWGARLSMHPWAGHDLPLDDPGWVVDAVVELQADLARR